MRILLRVEAVLQPWAAVRHEQRWGGDRARGAEKLYDVVVEWGDWEVVLDARIAINGHREVGVVREPAFCGGHQFEFFRGHHNPLAHLSVTGAVHLDGLGVVVVAVALEHVACLRERTDALAGKDAGAGRVDAGANQLARLHTVGIREHVGRACLWIAGGSDAVRDIREECPRLGGVHQGRVPEVRVGVDEARHNRATGHVNDSRAGRNIHGTAAAHANNAIVAHDDIGVVNDFRTTHRDSARAAQDDRAAGNVTRASDAHAHLGGLIAACGVWARRRSGGVARGPCGGYRVCRGASCGS